MLALAVETAALVDADLVFEPKYDGIRALAAVDADGRARLLSRLGNDKANQFPEVCTALGELGRRAGRALVLDGEIVAVGVDGEALGFQALQGRMHLTRVADVRRQARECPAAFVVFDVLRDGDDDVRGLPLARRRERLTQLALGHDGVVRATRSVERDGRALLEEAKERGWEGIVIKSLSAPYVGGARNSAWRKLKLTKEDDFVVGGWTEPRGGRAGFGALLLGRVDDGVLACVGHVGSGFDERTLSVLGKRLRSGETEGCPFVRCPETNERPHWTEPTVWVRVRYTGITDAGSLRHPVFLGVRDDLSPPKLGSRAEAVMAVPSAPQPVSEVEAEDVVAQLLRIEKGRGSGTLRLPGDERLDVTNLKKTFWPNGLTKGALLRHYARVAPYILPVVTERPLVMRRFPNGVEGEAFYQHRAPEPVPSGVRVAVLPDDDVPSRLVGGDLQTLLYMAQLASVSQDPWFSTVEHPDHAVEVAIDLDPMPDVPFSDVIDVARWVHDELERLSVPSFPKTSGATGLHIYVGLTEGTTYESGRLFAQIVATMVARKHPKVATVERVVAARGRTVYVDYLQNIVGKTLACAYSARATEWAGVSTPLRWDEVRPGLDPRDFTVDTIEARVRSVGDLWAGLRRSGARVDLRHVLERLARPQGGTSGRR